MPWTDTSYSIEGPTGPAGQSYTITAGTGINLPLIAYQNSTNLCKIPNITYTNTNIPSAGVVRDYIQFSSDTSLQSSISFNHVGSQQNAPPFMDMQSDTQLGGSYINFGASNLGISPSLSAGFGFSVPESFLQFHVINTGQGGAMNPAMKICSQNGGAPFLYHANRGRLFLNNNMDYTVNPATQNNAGLLIGLYNSFPFSGSNYLDQGSGSLHVQNTVTVNSPTGTYFDSNSSQLSRTSASTLGVSVYANGYVWSNGGFLASSDERIKTNITPMDDTSALNILRQVEPMTYNYIDTIHDGTDTVYGFIAQQVQPILPYAVSLRTEFIPNVYRLCTFTTESQEDTSMTIRISLQISASVGDKIQLMDNVGSTIVTTITDISESGIRVTISPLPPSQGNNIFVIGTQVSDFHALDKNYLYTINFAATQQLDAQVQSLEATVVSQQKTIQDLQSQLAEILVRLSKANL